MALAAAAWSAPVTTITTSNSLKLWHCQPSPSPVVPNKLSWTFTSSLDGHFQSFSLSDSRRWLCVCVSVSVKVTSLCSTRAAKRTAATTTTFSKLLRLLLPLIATHTHTFLLLIHQLSLSTDSLPLISCVPFFGRALMERKWQSLPKVQSTHCFVLLRGGKEITCLLFCLAADQHTHTNTHVDLSRHFVQ